ncbi:1-acyl-sn-glycerol-3-phosphate acyltransferase delta [Tetranychus urticae]|uniref:Phospholipid/glycerol acyltransferase domain-containing protein n=1 Tax=Tetranychus urticae TaxID=32264 RepID=T1KNJ7_TETUR|nr:1-acyl-sn-glycerol-3-phosphate acyltransferase delta [Tetranychus urticae]
MEISKYFELNLVIASLFGVIWIISGLILNIFQFLIYITVRPISPYVYRKINYYLIYSSWSQVVALAEYWAGCTLTVHFADKESANCLGTEHSIVLMNHKYEVDWLFSWILSDNFRILGSAKGFAKKEIRYLPVIGWGWFFCEMIFVSRQWEKDSQHLGPSVTRLMEYDDVVTLLIFAEGTRYTKEKYENSVTYCKDKGLDILEHHLYPRSRGFVYTINKLKDKLPAIYNIQIAFRKEDPPPTLTSILRRQPLHGYMYIQRVPMKNIPKESDEQISNFLLDVYKQKDQLTNYFNEHGKFPGEPPIVLKRRLAPLVQTLFWSFSVIALLIYFIYYLITSKSYILLTVTCLVISLGFISFLVLVRSTKTKKGSSYGTTSQAQTKKSL